MNTKFAAGLLSLALPVAALAAPGDMSVATFVSKADGLQKKGMLALMSSDMSLLKAEMKGASTYYRARLEDDRKAGRKPHSCPPAKASMNSTEIMAHMRSYPVADRARIPVKLAFMDLMAKKFPCR